jgi:hypothetical protein
MTSRTVAVAYLRSWQDCALIWHKLASRRGKFAAILARNRNFLALDNKTCMHSVG